MKLLFVVNSLDFFLSHRLEIAIAAYKAKYEVHVLTFAGGNQDKIIKNKFKFHSLNFKRKKFSFFNEILIFYHTLKIFYKYKPEIVHLVTLKPIVYGGMISKILSVKAVVIAFSGLGTIFTRGNKNYFFTKLLTINLLKIIFFKKNKLKVIFQNKDDQSLIKKLTKLKDSNSLIIRGSGVNLLKFKNLNFNNNRFVISMISRFLINKGVIEFIESSKILKIKYPKIIFRLVGSLDPGNPESLNQDQLEILKKDKNLEIIENSQDIISIINQSEIIVLPSYREGLPKVLLEASACEKSIVTTNVPGCRDIVLDKMTGMLVKPYNSLDLANKIEYLVLNKALRLQMGINGRKRVKEKFSLDYVISSHLNLYKDILR